MKKNKKSYEFFLSELFTGSEPELGYIIELMRAAGHIKEIQNILMMTSPPDSMDEDDAMIYEIEHESLRIFLFNISAAQLRESLLLFHHFRELSFYVELKNDFNDEQKNTAKVLEDYVNEYDHKKGLLYNILRPLRNKVFHYDHKEALEWGKGVIDDEKDEKPRVHYISNQKFEFGPGLEYDSYLFSKYLFWGEQGAESIMKAQMEIWQIHQHFLDFVRVMSEILMKRAKIPSNRPSDWFMKYRYGYKKDDSVS
ncbi:MAG: hypothetical protein O8C64_03610 [Candidatus Methanoperedens sp.]|nr:hypothetical protein [Candidatus Methanoperedens sp.]MCZ7405604.1 hypothetical protein [Candidatus Methanoperedens sp.]